MADINLLQASFNGGEIAPSLYARTNIDKYQSAAKRLKNVFVKIHGGLEKRGGTYFLDEVKDSAYPSRLVPFQFSVTQGYALEFGNRVMRVLTFDGLVLAEDSENVYQIETAYDIDEVWQMKTEQSADIIFIYHPSHAPKMLKRYGHNDWRFEDMAFVPGISAPTGLVATTSSAGSVNYKYKVTAILEKTGEESLPASVSLTSAKLSSTVSITLKFDRVVGCKKYSVYRYSNGMYGWISTIVDEGEGAKVEVIDDNVEIDFDVTPPTERNPFDGADNFPSTGAIFQQRMPMAATYDDPELIEISRPGNYKNFTMSNPLQDDDAISIRASGKQVNTVYDFIPLTRLLLTTANGIWEVSSNSDVNFLTPKSAKVKQQNFFKCQNLKPLIIGNMALFVEENRVRTLGYSLEVDGYDGTNISIFASHLFEGRKIIEWTYVSKTSQILFSFDDGAMVSLTFVPEHQLFAFTRIETKGWVESVCSVKDNDEEGVFAVVMREVDGGYKRYIERFVFNEPIKEKTDDFLYLDCASSLVSATPVSKLSGLSYLEGQNVAVWADGGYQGLKKVVSGEVYLDIPAKNIKVGLLFDVEFNSLGVDYPTSNLSASSQGKYKRIVAVDLAVDKTGYFEVAAKDEYDEFSEVSVSLQEYGVGTELTSGNLRLDLAGGFNKSGEIIIKASHPSPLCINAVIPEIVHGG
ncbi:MAG: hypothetical protein PHE89_02660 [Alphaproteobacteria bacterium]|nr:hypothetical protein [Alphaproteobacteria bacterium]